MEEWGFPLRSEDTSGALTAERMPFIGPLAAATNAAFSVSFVTGRSVVNVRSTIETLGVGTRMARPLSLPLSQTAKSGSLSGVTLSRTTATNGAELALQRADVSGTTTAARALAWAQLPLKQWLPDSLQPDRLPPVLAYAQAQRGLDGQHRAMAGLTTVLGAQRLSLSRYEEYGTNDHGTVVRAEHNQPRWLGADWQATVEHSDSAVGPQGYWRTGFSAERALGNGRKLLAQLTHQQDTYSYSALLQDGAKRRLTTVHVAFEQHIALKSEKVLIWRVFSGERRSNLELFNYNELGTQLSIVQNWR